MPQYCLFCKGSISPGSVIFFERKTAHRECAVDFLVRDQWRVKIE
jgi:hypothetical protein